METKTSAKTHVALTMEGEECIALMRALGAAIEAAKTRHDEQGYRCLLIQLERAAETGKGVLHFAVEPNEPYAADYERAWNECVLPKTAAA